MYTGRKGQLEPLKNINHPPTEDQVKDIIELAGRVVSDREALSMRGIAPEELIDGVEILDTQQIHDIILDHGEKIIPF